MYPEFINHELEEIIKGIVIIEAHSGLPLFSRLSPKIDSTIFSGLITAIKNLSEELTLGGLSSFTTESYEVYISAGKKVVVALLMENVDKPVAYQLPNLICTKFEEIYNIPDIPDTNDYLGFNATLEEIIKDFFAIEDSHLLYVYNEADKFILTKVVSAKEVIEHSILIHCSIPDKRIYILYNKDDIPSRIKYLANKEAKRINSELSNNQFTIRDIYDKIELEYMFSKIMG